MKTSIGVLAVLGCLSLSACGAESGGESVVTLGPVDGHDMAATELGRVALGDEAPGFTLESYAGQSVSLADYRGEKNVVLVFYRGHW